MQLRSYASYEADAGVRSDSGRGVLVLMLRFHGVPAEADQLRHQIGSTSIGVTDMLQSARAFGLKSLIVSSAWPKLAGTPLPAIAERKDRSFIIVAKPDVRNDLAKDMNVSAIKRKFWTSRQIIMRVRNGVLSRNPPRKRDYFITYIQLYDNLKSINLENIIFNNRHITVNYCHFIIKLLLYIFFEYHRIKINQKSIFGILIP